MTRSRRAVRSVERVALSLLLFSFWGAAAVAAHADDAPPDETTALDWKRRGDEAMDGGRAAEALAAYRQAAAIAPSAALEYNIGRALLSVGDFAGALAAFEHYDATAPEDLKQKTHRLADVMAELRSRLTTLTVVADVTSAGGHLTVRGADAGVLPVAPLRLNPGAVEIRVEREGYEPFTTTVDLVAGQPSRLPITLRPERVVARLAIVATPGARVTVDGAARGTTPLDLELAPGTHHVVLDAPKHTPRTIDLSLARDEVRRVDAQLVPITSPITTRWWFWTGAGVLVAGAAVTIAAFTIERAPSEGSLGTFRAP